MTMPDCMLLLVDKIIVILYYSDSHVIPKETTIMTMPDCMLLLVDKIMVQGFQGWCVAERREKSGATLVKGSIKVPPFSP